MQCKELESVLERDQISALPDEARAHVAGCVSCQNLVADFNAIIAAAERMPAEFEPPARVWTSLRAVLEAEGIIREQVPAAEPERPSFWQTIAAAFRGRVLATAVVGLVIVAGALFQLRSGPDSGQRLEITPSAPSAAGDPFGSTAAALNEQERDVVNMQRVSSGSATPVDASLQNNLRELDQFIAECSQHLKEQPHDEVAREYLAAAYQQKAELLSAMIDRGRSVN
ncbi:MAG TPA: anti-sigma factor [Candidatus Solibacter sp.]|nr:anti-sigma factor [Candidatus Solibacter sp.]